MDAEKQKHLDSVLRHIGLVQSATRLLGEKMIEKGEEEFGITLIANGLIHDNSKLRGIELEYLSVYEENSEAFNVALKHHIKTNPHHPEYWVGGIDNMPRIYLAECVCDWFSRSSEFATDLWTFINEKAITKYKIKKNGKVYKQIKEFVDLLVEKPFL